MRELTVGKNDAGQRLDRFVAKSTPRLPDSLLQKYFRLKRVKIGGRSAKRQDRVSEGDVVSLYISDEFFEPVREEEAYRKVSSPRLDIVYEDDNLLLVNKAPGVLCHGGDRPENALVAQVQAHCLKNGAWNPRVENSFSPALCNRIDRNTGGIVIAAKNAETLRIINDKIREREIDKYYLCVVVGNMSPPAGKLEGFIFKDAKKNQVYIRSMPAPGAKTAVTEYRTLNTRGGLSLLECRLVTGRTHQIRAQLAAAGCPLLGDGKYGSEKVRRAYGEKHQALWSYKLEFAFETDAGMLNYLHGKRIEIFKIEFVEKYFGNIG